MIFFFLSSGLFLGWSLGANDAANVFGSAVGTKMISFKKAALTAGLFVIIGAVVQGGGAAATLSDLGNVNAIAGSFTVALSAGFTVFYMNTRVHLPVSTTQSIVGSIIAWNFFTNNTTNIDSLEKIVSTWIFGPILGALFAILLYLLLKKILTVIKPHLLKLDAFLRLALLIVGAFGAYSLGANNIANVMGVFVSAAPTEDFDLILFKLTGVQQLFFIGGLAIAVGIFTHSKRIMEKVGSDIVHLSSEAALVVVLAHSLVLFIFSSQDLSNFVVSLGLPAIPLVPVSSSQVIVGSIVGIGLLKGANGIKFKLVGQIALGWVITPIMAGIIAFFALFFVNNVFQLKVSNDSQTVELMADTLQTTKHIQTEELLNISDSINTKQSETLNNNTEVANNIHYGIWKKISIILISLIILLIIWYFIVRKEDSEKKNKEIVKKREEFQYAEQELMKTELENLKLKKQHLQNELQLKNQELVNFALHIIQKDELFLKLKQKVDKIITDSSLESKNEQLNKLAKFITHKLNTDKDRETFYIHVEEENQEFLSRLNELSDKMTKNEKRLCALIRLGFSSKEIASIIHISPKSVEMNRYRLRKKLNIKSNENLNDYIARI